MRIRTLIGAATSVAILLALGLATATWSITTRLSEISSAQAKVHEVSGRISELLALTHEYATFAEARPEHQWRKHQEALIHLLEDSAHDRVPLPGNLLSEANSLVEIFQQLVETRATHSGLRDRQVNLLVSQLITTTQSVRDAVDQWAGALAESHQQTQVDYYRLSVGIPVMMLLILMLLSALLVYRVLRPLSKLHRAVQAVAQGDLTVRSSTNAKDEFGELSRAFDAMAVDLVSKLRQEINERKQIEVALTAREIELRAVIETEPECVKILAEDNCLLQMNRAGLDMIEAKSLDQVAGCSVLEIVAPEYRDAFKSLTHEVFQGTPGVLEFEIIGLKGTHRWLESHAVPLRDPQGKIISLLSITRDITERKQTDEELRRSNAELEQFSYSISHDMRQPLRMITGHMQLLERSIGKQLDKDQRQSFTYAIEGARRLDQMLVSLLEYSRVGRKGEPPAWEESRTLLDEALLFLKPAIDEAQASVIIEGNWPRIFVSPDEVMRLMQNLIGNAVKFRIPGRLPEIKVTSATLENEWQVTVADNGAGIDPGQIHRLFQVFQRLRSLADYDGTGIGLALCRKIVERHHGRIWVESAGEGQGSRFCFAMPNKQNE